MKQKWLTWARLKRPLALVVVLIVAAVAFEILFYGRSLDTQLFMLRAIPLLLAIGAGYIYNWKTGGGAIGAFFVTGVGLEVLFAAVPLSAGLIIMQLIVAIEITYLVNLWDKERTRAK